MTVAMVHGSPDDHRLWDRVRRALPLAQAERVVVFDLPGFAAPPPAGFEPTKESYVDWLLERLQTVARGGSIDLVGHDWGALLCLRAASLRPELFRTLAVGGATIDPTYRWHEPARTMQSAHGERYLEMVARASGLIPKMVGEGVPHELARSSILFEEFGRRCIARLYQSAVDIAAEWGPALDRIAMPSLVVWGERDVYLPVEYGRRLADRLGARFVLLGSGHYWPHECPRETAAALVELWS